jgi:hypothetical protein
MSPNIFTVYMVDQLNDMYGDLICAPLVALLTI